MIKTWMKKLSRLEWALFVFLMLFFSFFFNENPGWNVSSRMNLVYSIVDLGRFNIDYYVSMPDWKREYKTEDLSFYEGSFYCDKSPILSFLGVPVYWVYAQVHDVLNIKCDPLKGRYPVTLFTVSLFTSILAILVFRMLGEIRKSPRDQLMTTLFFSLGSVGACYAILFMAHQLSSLLIFLGFFLVYYCLKFWDTWSDRRKAIILASAGFSVGLATATETPTAIGMIGITIYAYFSLPDRKYMAWFVPAAIVAMILPMPYNWACFGSPFSSGYQYEAHPVFRAEMSRGISGVGLPSWTAFWGITFSNYRGLFFTAPFLLFAFPGLYYWWKNAPARKELLLSLFLIVGFIGYNSSYWAWYGGWAFGPRLLVPMVPFLVLGAYYYLPRLRYLFYTLGAMSVLMHVMVLLTDPQIPESYDAPFAQFTIPRFLEGNFTRSILSVWGLDRSASVVVFLIFVVIGISYLYWLAGHDPKSE